MGSFDDFSDLDTNGTVEFAQPLGDGKMDLEDIRDDMRLGMRTKGILSKHGLSLPQFEKAIKQLIRKGLITKDEFRMWKESGPSRTPEQSPGGLEEEIPGIETFVINEPEKNNSWSLQLFSVRRDKMRGIEFKVTLQGRKYSFVVEKLIFRGVVDMIEAAAKSSKDLQAKRVQAIDYIAKHGWSAYLESRAYEANFGENASDSRKKARLVLLNCRNQTILAALHTPTPAINLYVGSSLDSVRQRLSKTVDLTGVEVEL